MQGVGPGFIRKNFAQRRQQFLRQEAPGGLFFLLKRCSYRLRNIAGFQVF